ncbi:MAG: hypothetical protein ACREAZ_09960 [Nitrososphaera sp.]
MTRTLAIQYALMALVGASVLALSLAAPATAEEQSENVKVVMKVLDSANAEIQAEMLDLELHGMPVPIGAAPYYESALTEYRAAKEALDSGNANWARFHAMRAMEMFKTVSDLLDSPGHEVRQVVDPATLDENLAIVEKHAKYLETLAGTNNASINFADYDSTIQATRISRALGDIEKASEQLALARTILEDIQREIQAAADNNKEKRVDEFVEKMVTLLSRIVAAAERNDQMVDRESLIHELTSVVETLQDSTDVDKIMEIMADSSDLQTTINEHIGDISDSETTEEVTENVVEPVEESVSDVSNATSGSGTDTSSGSGTGGGNAASGEDPAQRLKDLADDLEDRANLLLAESNNIAANLLIEKALGLISDARQSIDEGNYDVAETALSAAKAALDEAEALIR